MMGFPPSTQVPMYLQDNYQYEKDQPPHAREPSTPSSSSAAAHFSSPSSQTAAAAAAAENKRQLLAKMVLSPDDRKNNTTSSFPSPLGLLLEEQQHQQRQHSVGTLLTGGANGPHKPYLAATVESSTGSFSYANKEGLPAAAANAEGRGEVGDVAVVRRRTRLQRVKAHIRNRRWVWTISGSLLFLVILAILLLTVIIPLVIRNAIDGNTLPLLGGYIGAVSPTQVSVGMRSEVNGPPPFTVRLDAFDLQLSNVVLNHSNANNKDVVHPSFLTLAVPELAVHGTTALVIENQTISVQNASELSMFLTRAFAATPKDGASLRVKGYTTAHFGVLKTAVTIDKEVHFGGVNNLAGTDVTHTEAIIPFAEDGANIQGSLRIPNTSPFTLSLGNITCDVVGMMGPGILDGLIGSTMVTNLVISPGNQTVVYRGQLDVGTLSDNVMGLTMNDEVTETGLVQIAFQGNNTVVDGQQIHYLDEVMRKINVLADVPFDVGSKVVFQGLQSSAWTFERSNLER